MSTSGELKLTTEKVLVFKNGDCLIIKKGVGTSRNNTYWTEDVPQNTILGSVWVDPKDGKLISFDAGVQTTKEKSKERVLCTDFFQLLDSNKGSKCTVLLPKDKVISGTIREALVNNIDEEKTDKPVQTSGLPDLSRSYRSEAIKGNLFVISNDQGDHIVRIDQVQQLILPQNSKLYTKKIITKTTKRLTFRFEPKEEDKQEKDQKNNENSEKDQKKTTTDSELSIDEKEKSDKQDEKKGELITRELIIVYFVVGVIRWIPTYRIQVAPKSEQMEITEDKKTPKQILDLSCQAEIINAGESLVDAYLELVVGVPSFKFRDTISPFSLEPTIKNLLNEKIPQIMGVSRAPNQQI
ncbi:hypothetical protein M0811_00765 [Anaeramoeba ignava]|uniref:Uncharacterized protein n=1 Tax=Anaeramoeba ignava TaxID=1746090 RepID=A0A9Q0LJT7_ANAIG|nr:hypothetical protein M0811_00765 [Anaeramoeba ignava]